MSSVAIQGNASGAGVFTIASPNSASSYTATLPTATTTLVGTDATQTLTNKTLTSPVINSATVTTVSGTAPLAMARAWVSFNGATGAVYGTPFNVSSVTRNATGNYTVNITTALPNTTYSTVASASANGSVNGNVVGVSVYCTAAGTNATPTTTAYSLLTYHTANATLQDTSFINCVSFA
jgi:hypothetical protein